jgi:multisubunit Na+/H+ antiporter MnhE subunit
MTRLTALGLLGINFLKDVVTSGWTTTLIILFRSRSLRPGFVRLAYGELPETAANFLGALVTLTPGTTTVDIDLERGELLLHLLDMDRADGTLDGIRRDFLRPIRILSGGAP